MKYLKLFEERSPLTGRKVVYQYLPEDVAEDLKEFVKGWIKEYDIINRLDKEISAVESEEYIEWLAEFNYNLYDVWLHLFADEQYINDGNIYYAVDVYLDNKFSTPAVRNSLSKILLGFYKEYKMEKKLLKKLIEILNDNPNLYDKYKDDFEEHIKLPAYFNRSRKTGLMDIKI